MFRILILALGLIVMSCDNYGYDQDKTKEENDKKKCETAVISYFACTSANPAMGACDSLYLGVLAVCGGGSSGGSGSGGGGY